MPARRPAAIDRIGARHLGLFIAFAGAVLLGGCADQPKPGVAQAPSGSVPGAKPRSGGGYKVGKPYQIDGVWYYPEVDYDYVEDGEASWYGPGFHGEMTANGEIYDMNDLTAAHRTLPMPSFVRVTNLENGRSLKLRINDRGPFARNRIIDVSRRGAQLLGFQGKGTARVRVEILAEESRQIAEALTGGAAVAAMAPPPAAVPAPAPVPAAVDLQASEPVAETPFMGDTGGQTAVLSEHLSEPMSEPQAQAPVPEGPGLQPAPLGGAASSPDEALAPVVLAETARGRAFVQAGAFADPANAHRALVRLNEVAPVEVTTSWVQGRHLFRVRLGPLASDHETQRVLAEAIRAGFQGSHVVID
jgi:rare lipoprotein A